ncbi:MAG TPA: SRPBCC family protein [Terriglobales bacterium]|nr:SRPBCC family protein [Terriglobales bacterium]
MKHFEYEAIARCKPQHVWQVFSDMDRWSEWNPVVGKSHWLTGAPWKPGSTFFMEILQPKKIIFRPMIQEILIPIRVSWTGKAPGFAGTHGHEFILMPDGTTRVRTWEDVSGFLTLFIGKRMHRQMMDMYAAWINALCREGEKLAAAQLAKASQLP